MIPNPVATIIERLQPGADRLTLIAWFDGRAPWETIRKWKSGHLPAPHWAIDLLEQKELQRAAAMQAEIAAARQAREQLPGRRAGAKNLAAYLARR